MQFFFSISLPAKYRFDDVLAFHGRDPKEIAERVSDTSVHKGIVLRNKPVYLSIRFQPGLAEASIIIDGEVPEDYQSTFKRMIRRMLGLTQEIEIFEEQYRNHEQLGMLITQQLGLRVPVTASPFEALTWAITGQQISISAAVSLRRKLIRAANIRHSCGLLCYPGPEQILELPEEVLRQAGFSASKTRTLLTLASLVASNKLPLDTWVEALPVDVIREQLELVRGIGPWTVNYTLLRGFGWLDGSLHGDAAVRRGLQTLLNSPDKISEEYTRTWLEQFSPWRALIVAHIWAFQSSIARLKN